jgi:hypothetical protein
MEVFGSFEATEVAREGNFGVIMYARKAGISDRKFAIKVFRPPEFLMDDDQIVREAESFLDSAEAQQRAHVAASGVWAPVYEMGKCQGGAWYATDLHEGSLEWLRITQRDLEPEHIRKVVEPIVQGLLALKVGQGRPHGNLKATNILLQGRADLSRARIFLCDPKPTSRCKSPEDDQNDARDLGNIVHQLILHRQFQNATEWPLQNTDAWKRLGKTGAAWLDVVNKLIDPTTTKKPTIQEIAAMMPGGAVAVPAGGKASSAGPTEAERKAAKEEAERKAKEEDERRKRNEAEIARKVREQAEKDAAAKAEAEKKAKEDAERKAREAEAAKKSQEEAAQRAKEEEAKRQAERAEADRKAKEAAEKKAKEDAERRAREAEAAKKAKEEADQRTKEEEAKRQVERAEAERKAKEAAEKKAKEDADRRAKAEEERRVKEDEARKQAELKALQKAEQDAKEKERLEAERKAKEEDRKVKEEAKRKAQEEAEKKKAEAAEAKAKAAAEAAASRAAALEAKQAQAREQAKAKAEAATATGDSSSSLGEPKPAGSKKGLVIAAAALVAIAGTVGVVMAMRGGGDTPAVTPGPGPQPDPSGSNANANNTNGTNNTSGTQDPPVPTPTAPTAQEIANAVTRRAGELEPRIAEDIALAARAAVEDHRRASTDRLTTIAKTEVQRAVESASVETPPADVRTSAQRAAEQALTTAFAQGLNTPVPTRATRATLAAIAGDLSKTVLGDLAGADQAQVETASGNSIDQAAGRLWQGALTTAANAARSDAISQIAAAAADGARSAFETRVADSNRTTEPPVQPQPEPEPQPQPQPEPPPTPPAITEADIAAARQQVAAVATLLDGGSTLDAQGLAAARQQLQVAEGAKGFERVGTEPATERIRARLDSIDRIIAADAAGIIPLVQGASSQTGGASELMAAWSRLGQVGQGVALPQLVQARTAAIAAMGGFDGAVQPRARQIVDATTRQIWNAQAGAAASEQAIEQVRASKDTLEIPDEGLPASYSFNVALLDFKTQIRAVSSTGDERLGVLKEPAQRFVQRVSALAPIAQEQAVQSAIAWAGEIAAFTPGAPQPAGAGDLSRVGPGSVGWTKSGESPDGQQVEYTIPAVGNRFREERLVFYRVGSTYLSASEVSVALFRRLFSGADSLEAIRGAYSDPPTGLKVWRIESRSVTVAEGLPWSSDFNYKGSQPVAPQIAAWGGRPAAELTPLQTWPVQALAPRAAAVVAGKLGCRLPTLDEWRAAVQAESGQMSNLRDTEWFKVLAAVRAFRFLSGPIYPDSGAVQSEGTRAEGPTASDGYPFFAPVDSDGFGSRWRHLRGNVAEWVFLSPPAGPEPIITTLSAADSSWDFGIVGGSAVGPPASASPDQVIRERDGRGWFDVGFRLAFSAPGGVAAAPTPSPADGRVAELQGLAYLVAERR